MIRLSIIIPSNRDSPTALARIYQACSWAGPQTEVIIRDNSGSASKARFLTNIRRENCHIIVTDPCGPHENMWSAFDQAKGDFVFFLSDDDFCFDRAVAELPGKIEQVGDDVVGVSGAIVIESGQGSGLVAYSDMPTMR
jgi:hypothetical protein